MNKKFVLVIMTFILALPGAFAATSLSTRLGLFYQGTRGLVTGSPGYFMTGLVALLPVIGLIFVIFGLMFYLSKITIFRGDGTDKYARWFAIGISLLGLAQQSVFNAILGWTGTFLILAFIMAIIFMFVIFLNQNRKSHYTVAGEMNKERKSFLSSKMDYTKEKREFKKLTHEMGLDDKLYMKTERDLKNLDNDLRSLDKLQGDELKVVDHLADLLRKAAAAGQRNEQNQMHGYVQALSRDLGGLITTMGHDRVDMHKAQSLLADVRKNLAYAFKDETAELSEDKHIEEILKRHMEHVHEFSHMSGDPKTEEMMKKVLTKGTTIHSHIVDIRHAALALKRLEDQVEQHMEQLAKYGYDSKQAAASAVRDAVMTQDFTEAHKQLDHLRGLVEHGRQQSGDVYHLEQEMGKFVSRIEENERALTHLVHDLLVQIDRDTKEESNTFKKDGKEIGNLESHKKTIKASLDIMANELKNAPNSQAYAKAQGLIDSLLDQLNNALDSIKDKGDFKKTVKSYLQGFESIIALAKHFDAVVTKVGATTTVKSKVFVIVDRYDKHIIAEAKKGINTANSM